MLMAYVVYFISCLLFIVTILVAVLHFEGHPNAQLCLVKVWGVRRSS